MSAILALQLGDVLRLMCTLCVDRKLKYYVVVHVNPLRMFLINSNLTPLQQQSAQHIPYNPVIRASEHAFLTHDSYIGCDHLSHEHSYEQAMVAISKDPSCYLGRLSDSAKGSIAGILGRSNPHLAGKHLKQLRIAWGLDPAPASALL